VALLPGPPRSPACAEISGWPSKMRPADLLSAWLSPKRLLRASRQFWPFCLRSAEFRFLGKRRPGGSDKSGNLTRDLLDESRAAVIAVAPLTVHLASRLDYCATHSPRKRTDAVQYAMSAMGHVWTAPGWQELSSVFWFWSRFFLQAYSSSSKV
jgi:hypothetical protein